MHDSHTLETALRDARAYESNVRDNVQFREAEKAYADAQAQHAALDLEAAYSAHAKANQVYDEARRAEQALGGRAAHLRGEMAGIEAELARRLQIQRSVLCLGIRIRFLCLAELDIVAHIGLVGTCIAQRCLKGMCVMHGTLRGTNCVIQCSRCTFQR